MNLIKLKNSHSISWYVAHSSDSGEPYILYTKQFKGITFKEKCSLLEILDKSNIYVYNGERELAYSIQEEDDTVFVLATDRDSFTRTDSKVSLKLVLVELPDNTHAIHYYVFTEGHFVKSFEDFDEAFNFAFIYLDDL